MFTRNQARQRPMPRAAATVRRGFTLVEILSVVVILGIASAIIIPQMGTRDDMRAKAAARTLIADLIYCQNLAISTGKPCFIRFDVADSSWRVITSPTSTNTATWGVPVSHPLRQDVYITKFGARSDAATDTGWGLPTQDATVTVHSADFDGIDTNFVDEFTIGFDPIGSPLAWCYDLNQYNDLNTGNIELRSGKFKITVGVSAATGEVTVTEPSLW